MDVTNEPHQRLAQVEREVHSLTTDMSNLAQGQSELRAIQRAQGERLERIGEGVDRLIEERAHRGWNTGNVIAVLGFSGTLLFGISQYIDLQLGHVKDDIQYHDDKLSVLAEFRMQTHHEFGRLFEYQAGSTARLDHYVDLYHDLDSRVREEERNSSASNVSRRAIGDYVKEVAAQVP